MSKCNIFKDWPEYAASDIKSRYSGISSSRQQDVLYVTLYLVPYSSTSYASASGGHKTTNVMLEKPKNLAKIEFIIMVTEADFITNSKSHDHLKWLRLIASKRSMEIPSGTSQAQTAEVMRVHVRFLTVNITGFLSERPNWLTDLEIVFYRDKTITRCQWDCGVLPVTYEAVSSISWSIWHEAQLRQVVQWWTVSNLSLSCGYRTTCMFSTWKIFRQTLLYREVELFSWLDNQST